MHIDVLKTETYTTVRVFFSYYVYKGLSPFYYTANASYRIIALDL